MPLKSQLRRSSAAICTAVAAIFLMAAAVGSHGPITIEPPDGAWTTKLDAGIAAVRKPNAPALLMFSASWCPDCKRMKKNVLNTPQVQQNLKKWDLIYVDNDTYLNISIEYQARYLPTVAMLDAQGLEMIRFFDDVTPEEFIALSDDMLARGAALEKLAAELKKNPGDAGRLKAYADAQAELGLMMLKVDPRILKPMPARLDAALDGYKRAQAAGDKSPETAADIEFIEAVNTALKGNIEQAAGPLAAFETKYPQNPHAADAMFWRAVLVRVQQVALTRTVTRAKAPRMAIDLEPLRGMFQSYLDRYPNGRYAGAARKIVKTLAEEQAKSAAKK
ncbi:MAG: thioredoxin family protein [Candidatus Sumerlaeia bacterium]